MKRKRRAALMALSTTATTSALATPSWQAALAIVPDESAWETIQTCRYHAQDSTYALWPPALRLFHPFPTDLHDQALGPVAEVARNWDPFSVRLSEWSIIPHTEAMGDVFALTENTLYTTTTTANDERVQQQFTETRDENDLYFDVLTERLQELGKIRKARRKPIAKRKKKKIPTTPPKPTPKTRRGPYQKHKHKIEFTYKEQLAQQLSQMDEFNGPCIVCLEPDAESTERLRRLRADLCAALPESQRYAPYYTPSASLPLSVLPVVAENAERQHDDIFRPVVPIGAFATVSQAMEVARRLRQDLEPISFNVTDLQLISSCGVEKDCERAPIPRPPTAYTQQFGCDALVSLRGEEVPMDEEWDQQMAHLLTKHGLPGGYECSSSNIGNTPTVVEDATESSIEEAVAAVRPHLQDWLLKEDDTYDEGTVLVMGQVQMFTGEMREYVGMPALRDHHGGGSWFVEEGSRRTRSSSSSTNSRETANERDHH